MSELLNDMERPEFTDDVRALHLKLDNMTKKLALLDEKVNGITESQQIGGETVRKSANSINIIIRFLADLRKLSREELKNTVIEADAIINTVNLIPTEQNLDETLEPRVTQDNLKMILREVFNLLNSLPLGTRVDANNCVASTSTESRYDSTKVEEKKIQIWRKYKNKYNYIDKLKLPLLKDTGKEVGSLQNDVNDTVQNDVNDNTQNDVNDAPAQNNLNDLSTYTINDIIQNEEVYELFKSRLKNSPYDEPGFKNNVKNSMLTLAMNNGETIVKPVRLVAPLIILKKCDDLFSIPLQNKETTDKHFPSTSKKDLTKINDSNSNKTTAKRIIRETRSNKTSNLTNSFNADVKTGTKTRHLTIKKSKYEPSKKKKKN